MHKIKDGVGKKGEIWAVSVKKPPSVKREARGKRWGIRPPMEDYGAVKIFFTLEGDALEKPALRTAL